MESFLNDFCISFEDEVTSVQFKLEFNYSFLAPPVQSTTFNETDPEGKQMVAKAAMPETESLWHMSQSKEHKYLLQHPVIISFLWLKVS